MHCEQLWNIIAAVPEEVPTPQWHLDLPAFLTNLAIANHKSLTE
ncbi:hypothetical protein [Argonema antarcticum]|nr:hypothetical protein [Argonema antarcticum]